jgi:hypothetical protein
LALASKRVLVDLTVLHDQHDVVRVHQEADVPGRVAVDQEDVGVSALLNKV